MKNKAKRIVSAVCALAMCAAMLPAAAMAADGETDSAASNAADTATVDETTSDGTTDGTEPGADSQPAPAENSGIATLSDPVEDGSAEDVTGDDPDVLYVDASYAGDNSNGAKDAPFTTIQDAVDAVWAKGNSAAVTYTIHVAEGTYTRFFVPAEVQNVVIDGAGDGTIVNVADGSPAPASFSGKGTDTCGIIVYGGNITIQNMKIEAGSGAEGDTWARSAIGTVLSNAPMPEGYKLTVKNCTFVGQGETTACYGVLMSNDSFEISGCSFDGFSSAIEMMGDGHVTKDCQIVNNTITNCNYAIHGYYGKPEWGASLDTTGVAHLVITDNTICGDGNASNNTSAYTVVTLTDNFDSGALKIDMHGNTFSYAIVGGLALEGDVAQGSLENLLTTNAFTNNSFVVDARLTLDESGSPTGYYDTNYYAPKQADKIATWYADPWMDTTVDKDQLIENLENALNQYGSAGQVLVTNPEDAFDYSLAKNALVIKEYVDAGDLKITKQVTNHVEDETEFTFTIHFTTKDDIDLRGRYEYSIDGGELQTATLVDGNMTVSLKAGQSVTIQDMLPGTKYTVTETSSPLYIASGNGATGTIVANQTQEVTVTNEFLTDASHGDDSVAIDKNATDLVNDQTNVTLSVGGTEDELSAYVLFVLDKSTSNDVRAEAAAMLEELMGQVRAGYKVNVAIMSFERAVDEVQDWMVLDESTYETIKTNLTVKREESGTNIYLGLREAKEKLDALTDVDPAYKHLVLVTDGITYLWSNSEDENDTNLYSIYSESISNGEESINAGNDMMASHHADYDAFVAEFADMAKWMSDHGSAIAADIAKYQHVYAAGQYRADQSGLMENSTYTNAGFKEGDYIPGESLTEHYSANEAAIYMAATVWQEIVDAGYHAYAFADVTDGGNDTNARTYPWASRFIYGLHTIGGNTGVIGSGNVDGMFDDVKSSVVYAIESGTVTDVIGNDFDLTDVSSFELTVGGQAAAKEVSGNTVTFNGGDYVVTYHPATADQDEYFTWDINTRVENGSGLQLTYTLKLVNKASEAGDYTVPTNEIAYLEYTSTTGGQGSQEFPVPTVDYNIPPETVTVPSTPTPDEHPDIAEGIANGTWGGTPTPTPTAQTTAIPQTSDDLPLGLLIVVAIAAAGAVCGLVVLRKRSKQ